jgi:hypothetical protein
MNLQETIALLQALKSTGAKYFKSNDFEVRLDGDGEPEILTMRQSEPKIDPNFNPTSTAQAESLIDILKMKDEDLVNKIFPAGA